MPVGTFLDGFGAHGVHRAILCEMVPSYKKQHRVVLYLGSVVRVHGNVISSNIRDAHVQLGADGCHAGHLFNLPLLHLRLKIYHSNGLNSTQYQPG